MKKKHIVLYHATYWINRVVNIWAFVYFIYGESWYRGAYVVLLVLMPFFYTNYGILIPSLLEKKRKKFFILTLVWIICFVWAYSKWTIYQRFILYGEELWAPDYIETANNLISIWLISSGSCLFEFWIKNREKNQKLSADRTNHLLKSEQNLMLNHLLSDYLTTLDKRTLDELPDKILLLSDFFKYVLYNRDKVVPLKTEIGYIELYQELKNSNGSCVKVHYEFLNQDIPVRSTRLIAIINRLVVLLSTNKVLHITIACGLYNEALVSTSIPENPIQKENLFTEFSITGIPSTSINGRFTISVDQYFANTSIPD